MMYRPTNCFYNCTFLCAIVLLVIGCFNITYAKHLHEPDYAQEHLACDLQCMNDGVCRFDGSQDQHELQHKIQSGKLVMKCICPLNFIGMACDIEDKNNNNECAEADSLSLFAGEQCRKPFTEYCASLKHSVGGHVSFCTNGGKCKSDYLAAQIAPGNTTANLLFQ